MTHHLIQDELEGRFLRQNFQRGRIPSRQSQSRKLRPIRNILMEMNFKPVGVSTDQVPWREVMKDEITQYGESGLAIRGARARDGMSQKELAVKLGIAQYNLSKMENGERSIGKKMAMKLAEIFNSDYRVFL